ncbi:MAG: protein-glutamate methylesterase/protein-glutamine glutaminase [Acidimicrobiales bacterium]
MVDRLVKTLVVDDSTTVRRMVSGWIEEGPGLELVGSASNGADAIHQCRIYDPDVVVLDVEMPGMSGLEALHHIVREDRSRVVIMFSALTREGIGATIEALDSGAADYITKPSSLGGGRAGLEETRRELLEKAVALGGRRQRAREVKRGDGVSYRAPSNIPRKKPRPVNPPPTQQRPIVAPVSPAAPTIAKVPPKPLWVSQTAPVSVRPAPVAETVAPKVRRGIARSGTVVDAVVVGSSTGGPAALTEIIPKLPHDFPVPLLLVQHMPALFAQMLAERLDAKSQLTVKIAENGESIRRSVVYIAPGGMHLQVARHASGEIQCVLVDLPPENSCKPAANILFRSAVEVWGSRLLGVVLTGMGSDGTAGAESIVRCGGRVIVQDEESSVVWGMPGSIVQAGLHDGIFPLNALAGEVVDRVLHRASARSGHIGEVPRGVATSLEV